MKCNKEYLGINQGKTLRLFLDNPKKLDLLFCEEISTAEDTKLEFSFKPNDATTNDFYRDEPYEYHAKLVKMLYYTCVGKKLHTNFLLKFF